MPGDMILLGRNDAIEIAVAFPGDRPVEAAATQTHEIMWSHLAPAERARLRTLPVAGSSDGYCMADFRSLAETLPTWASTDATTGWFLPS